ncbi:MAG: methylated-DNA--[protein]-cysteine S-methyltransferase [Dehalococcoidia bacterium]
MGLFYDVFETTWGWVGAVSSEKGLRYASLPEESPDRAVEYLTTALKGALPEHRPGALDHFKTQVEQYLGGERTDWDVALDIDDATDFFKRAWEACQTIPPGETRSYQWLAEQAGKPAASRGAGQAMARNRVPLVIPCHRVIGSNGALHGFGGPGLPLKARLLAHERELAARQA